MALTIYANQAGVSTKGGAQTANIFAFYRTLKVLGGLAHPALVRPNWFFTEGSDEIYADYALDPLLKTLLQYKGSLICSLYVEADGERIIDQPYQGRATYRSWSRVFTGKSQVRIGFKCLSSNLSAFYNSANRTSITARVVN